jgi:hypothetical protein
MIVPGDKIIDTRVNSIHIVESVETISRITVCFTTDSKCIPLEYVKKTTNIVQKLLNHVLFKNNLTENDRTELKEFMSSIVTLKHRITPEYGKSFIQEWKRKNLK